ncbi:MAG: branched-chain amino acid ABC transporter permease, partial [Proteobacteria bacterium]|nr:branched-chain amino acid ABC transporter permease [Pseudomonadota bacterium]
MPVGQLLVEGLAIGACYGLFATAVVMIYKTSEVINFAQGEMAMFSSFVAFHILSVYQLPFWAAFVITLGAEMFLMGLAGWKWGAEQKFFSLPLDPSVTYEPVKGMIINNWAIAVFTVTTCIMLCLYVFFKYTKLGVAMRATQQNKHAAKIMGIRTEWVFSFAWGSSSLIGAIAGMFFASRATLDPAFMMEPFLRAFAAAVLGGLMSIPGVIIGGGLMGLIE